MIQPPSGSRFDLPLQGAKMRRRARGDETAGAAIVGIELLALDQTLQMLEGGAGAVVQRLGFGLAETSCQVMPVELDAAADHAAIAAAGAGAEMSPFQDGDLNAGPGQLQRRCQTAIAATDDRDVDPIGQG